MKRKFLKRAFDEIENLRCRINDLESQVKRLECDHPQQFIEYIKSDSMYTLNHDVHHRRCTLCKKSLGVVKVAEVIEDKD